MTPQDFAYLASLIHNRSGIVLPAEKAYLLENRLRPLSGEFSFGSMADLVSALKLNRDERLARRVVEVMTTNETLSSEIQSRSTCCVTWSCRSLSRRALRGGRCAFGRRRARPGRNPIPLP